jgi:hypothetical protein
MYECKCEVELTQSEEIIKHINMDIVMIYVNQLHNTRRLYRNFHNPKLKELNKKYLKYPPEAYGGNGDFYPNDDYLESTKDYNYCGSNPSLWMPFFIEKNNENKYFLKIDKNPQSNNFDSIEGWISFLYDSIFCINGIETKGKIQIINLKTDEKVLFKINEKEILRKSSIPDEIELGILKYMNIEHYLKEIKENELIRETYFPKLFKYMSEEIENKKKLNNDLENNLIL